MSEIEFYQKALWVVGAVCGSFGSALVYLVVWNAKQLLAKQEDSDRKITDKLDSIEKYMQNEIRTMDVRLSVVETLVLPQRPQGAIVRPQPIG